jgi:hypothetical protein
VRSPQVIKHFNPGTPLEDVEAQVVAMLGAVDDGTPSANGDAPEIDFGEFLTAMRKQAADKGGSNAVNQIDLNSRVLGIAAVAPSSPPLSIFLCLYFDLSFACLF